MRLTTEERLDRLEMSLANASREMIKLTSEITRLSVAGVATEASELGGKQVDQPWQCKKCERLIGWYDPAADVLRLKSKTETTFLQLGNGGWIERLCWGCSELNRIEYVPPKEDEG